MFSSLGGFLSYVIGLVHQHRKPNQTQLKFLDETKKRASDLQLQLDMLSQGLDQKCVFSTKGQVFLK